MNVTFTVPAGSALYGDQLCTPPGWIDILTFYASNYLIHVGTVPLFPGEKRTDVYIALVSALLFPVIGVARGLDRIARFANLGKTPLEKAARAGALCMVVRNEDWTPSHAPAATSTIASTTSPARPSEIETDTTVISSVGTHEKEVATVAVSPVEPRETKSVTVNTSTVDAPDPKVPSLTPSGAVKENASTSQQLTFRWHDGDFVTLPAPWQKEKEIFRWFCWAWIGTETSVDIHRRRELAAVVQLPPGYSLAFVPQDAVVLPLHADGDDEIQGESNRRDLHERTGRQSSASGAERLSPPCKKPVVTFLAGLPARWRGILASFRPTQIDRQVPASEGQDVRIAPSSDIFSSIAGVAQLTFGLSTLFETTGPQVNRFGYAAFGLTVLPYLIMSIINTTAIFFTPTYSSMYLVHSEIMDEALGHPGAHFEGTVGRIPKGSTSLDDYPEPVPDYNQADLVLQYSALAWPKEVDRELVLDKEHPTIDPSDMPTASRYIWDLQGLSLYFSTEPLQGTLHQRWLIAIPSHPPIARRLCLKGQAWPPSDEGLENSKNTPLLWTSATRLLVSLICFLPLGLLTHFHAGESSVAERVITMSWLATGFVGLAGLGIMKVMGSGSATMFYALLHSMKLWDPPAHSAAGEDSLEHGVRPVSESKAGFTRLSWQIEAFACLLCSAPAIAGLVIVGLMFSSFGTCTKFS
jgi:hypothetical protein